LGNLGNPHKSNITKNVEFKGTQILDTVFWKWFLVNSSFQALNLEVDELEENSPTKARRRNLLPGVNAQSQGAPMDMEESSNLAHLVGETRQPQ
jgi:hypothetical protein